MIPNDKFDELNSMTKYPSIPTYHRLDERGRIAPDAAPQVDFDGQEVVVTEKIDGANGRIVTFKIDGEVDWVISRGRSEGVVVRTLDRSRIAKIRFDDYRRLP